MDLTLFSFSRLSRRKRATHRDIIDKKLFPQPERIAYSLFTHPPFRRLYSQFFVFRFHRSDSIGLNSRLYARRVFSWQVYFYFYFSNLTRRAISSILYRYLSADYQRYTKNVLILRGTRKKSARKAHRQMYLSSIAIDRFPRYTRTTGRLKNVARVHPRVQKRLG